MNHGMSEELERTLNDVITDFSLLADANQFLASFQAGASFTDHQQKGLDALLYSLGRYGVMLADEKHQAIFGS